HRTDRPLQRALRVRSKFGGRAHARSCATAVFTASEEPRACGRADAAAVRRRHVAGDGVSAAMKVSTSGFYAWQRHAPSMRTTRIKPTPEPIMRSPRALRPDN